MLLRILLRILLRMLLRYYFKCYFSPSSTSWSPQTPLFGRFNWFTCVMRWLMTKILSDHRPTQKATFQKCCGKQKSGTWWPITLFKYRSYQPEHGSTFPFSFVFFAFLCLFFAFSLPFLCLFGLSFFIWLLFFCWFVVFFFSSLDASPKSIIDDCKIAIEEPRELSHLQLYSMKSDLTDDGARHGDVISKCTILSQHLSLMVSSLVNRENNCYCFVQKKVLKNPIFCHNLPVFRSKLVKFSIFGI